MKKPLSLILALALCLSLAACGKAEGAADGKTTLVVFAAASLQDTLSELGEAYQAEHTDVALVFNFDSSGTLKTQIVEGADCDLFLSAGQKQMDQLDAAADPSVNAESLDYVLQGSRCDLLENKVALAVSEGNPAELRSYADMASALRSGEILLAMGNADVPVGQYTAKILAYFDLNEEELAAKGVISYGSNAREVTTQVAESVVDCGIVYATDAFSAGLTVVDTATAAMCGQVIYPAAVMKTTQNIDAAKAFLEYLTQDAADAVFAAAGFTPVG